MHVIINASNPQTRTRGKWHEKWILMSFEWVAGESCEFRMSCMDFEWVFVNSHDSPGTRNSFYLLVSPDAHKHKTKFINIFVEPKTILLNLNVKTKKKQVWNRKRIRPIGFSTIWCSYFIAFQSISMQFYFARVKADTWQYMKFNAGCAWIEDHSQIAVVHTLDVRKKEIAFLTIN